MLDSIIEKRDYTRTILILLGLFLLFSVISSFVLCKTIAFPLDLHFAAMHLNISNLKDSLLFKTIMINIFFYLITSLGVLFLSILYSHRIAGPFVKLIQFTKIIAKAQFNHRIAFRKKDAIHSLGFRLNEMVKTYDIRCCTVSSLFEQLEKNLNELETLNSQEDMNLKNSKLKEIRELDAAITDHFRELEL